MNYRHEFHAGNFADVVKHVALSAILLHLKKKEAGFAVIDSHAGRGIYDLASDAAQRTGEADSGIARVRDLKDGPDALRTYLDLAATFGSGRYPGSPLIAARLMRPQDRLVAIEKHPEAAAALKTALAQFRKARVIAGDGYGQLPALLPPAERRGLVLIDPPYEALDEFEQAVRAVREVLRRFAQAIIMVWFPIKSKSAADAFCGEIALAGAEKTLRIDVDTRPDAGGERLSAAGLMIVNPPYGLDATMRDALAILAPHLGASPARAAVARISATGG